MGDVVFDLCFSHCMGFLMFLVVRFWMAPQSPGKYPSVYENLALKINQYVSLSLPLVFSRLWHMFLLRCFQCFGALSLYAECME